MPLSKEPFKDRLNEDHVRDYVLFGIFSALAAVLIAVGFFRLGDGNPVSANETLVEAPPVVPVACPDRKIPGVVAKNEANAVATIMQRVRTIPGEWIVEEFTQATGEQEIGEGVKESARVNRYLFRDEFLVGEIEIEGKSKNKVLANIIWRC